MQRLFKARISFEEGLTAGSERGQRWPSMEVAPKSELWWIPKRPDQAVLWKAGSSWARTSTKALVNNPVPVDMRALRALKSSTLALDLYMLGPSTGRSQLGGRASRSSCPGGNL